MDLIRKSKLFLRIFDLLTLFIALVLLVLVPVFLVNKFNLFKLYFTSTGLANEALYHSLFDQLYLGIGLLSILIGLYLLFLIFVYSIVYNRILQFVKAWEEKFKTLESELESIKQTQIFQKYQKQE